MGHVFLALNHEVSELLASLKQVQEKQNKVRFVFFPAKKGGVTPYRGMQLESLDLYSKTLGPQFGPILWGNC